MKFIASIFPLLGGILLFASSLVRAATLTWDGDGAVAGLRDAGGIWLGTDPWWNGTTNVAWTSGDSAVFGNGGTGGAVILASPTTVESLTFNSFSGIYTLGSIGQTITLNNGITMNSGAGGVNVISSITLGAVQTWLNNSSSLFSVDGPVNNNGFQLTVAGRGNTTLSNIISGTGGLTKTGEGATTVFGVNTFSGETNILAGILQANSSAALGDGSATNTLVFNGGTLQAGGNITSPATRGVTLDSTGIIDTHGFAVDIAGVMSGSGDLTKNGAGTLTLTAANTYTGITTINGGTLALSGTTGAIASSISIILSNKGTFTISNTSASNNTNRIGNATGLLASGGTFNFFNDGSNTAFSESMGTLTLSRGALTINTSQAGASGTSILTLASISRAAGGGTVLFSGTGFGVNTRNQVRVAAALNTQNVGGILPWALIKDGITYDLAVGGAANGAITKVASYNTGAQSTWAAASNARPTADQILTNNRSLNSLVLDSGIDLNAPGSSRTITIGSATRAGLIVQTGGTSSISGGITTRRYILAFGIREGIFNTIGNLTLLPSATVGTNLITGSGGITKSGPGALILGSNNRAFQQSVTGQLALHQGLYEIFSGSTTSLSTLSTGIVFNGGNLTIHDTAARAFNNPLVVNADATVTLDRHTASTGAGSVKTFGTLAISNNPNLTITAGPSVTSGIEGMTVGTVTLNSEATFTLTNSTNGTIQLSLGAVTNGANTVNLGGNGNLIQTGVWGNGTGGLTLDSTYSGVATLSAANTYTGTTTIRGGTLRLNGAGVVISTDGGTATTSDIVIEGGTLRITASEQIANTGSIDMSSGAFNFGVASGLTETIDKFTNSGGTFITGDNTLDVLGATVTWSGGTNTISSGGVVKDKHVVITGGTNTVNAGGELELKTGGGTAGLLFGGTASPTITLDSSAGTAGKITLNQNVTVDNTLTSGTAQILNGGALANAGFIDMVGGTRTFTVNNGSAATDMLVSAILTNGGLTKDGAGRLNLTGINTYTGATTVSGGILGLEGSGTINTTSGITVAAGATLLYNSSTALTVAPTLSGAGTGSRTILGGDSTINTALTTLNDLGDVLSPGATATSSLGVLSFATAQTWASNSYDWEINDWAASVAGTNIDKIEVSGALDLSATAANSYQLNIISLKNDDNSGLIGAGGGSTFSETTKSWTIITASGGITGFAASEWNLNAAGFLDGEGGTWSISQNVNDLVLTYTAVPEPRAALLGGIGLLLLLRRRR